MRRGLLTTAFFTVLSLSLAEHGHAELRLPGHCINLTHIDGQKKNICESSGKPFVIVEFFSAHCSHCRRNVPLFKRLEEATSSQAYSRMVSVNRGEEALQFSRDFDVSTDIAIDNRRVAADEFGVRALPSLFVLDAQKRVVYRYSGVLNENAINHVIRLVGASSN